MQIQILLSYFMIFFLVYNKLIEQTQIFAFELVNEIGLFIVAYSIIPFGMNCFDDETA